MIELSNTTAQIVAPGQAVTFDRVVNKCGNGECFNSQIPTSVKLKGNGMWDLSFSGNVTTATVGENMQLHMTVGGTSAPIAQTQMNRTTVVSQQLENISTKTAFKVCCCDMDRISVTNTGAVAIALAPNSSFLIERRS